jgi:hypothetical protein
MMRSCMIYTPCRILGLSIYGRDGHGYGTHGGNRNAYGAILGKPEGMRSHGRSERRRENC